jgi:hypothetical protein
VNPTPSPIDVLVHPVPAADWQVWAAFAPLLAAIIAAAIAGAALWQRRRADNRAEWWRRAQWALDASLSSQATRAKLGQQAISILGRSKLATPEDGVLLKIGTEDALEAAQGARPAAVRDPVDAGHEASHTETDTAQPSRRPESASTADRKVQIAAAKARITLDKLTGDATPQWIISLSEEAPG